MGIEGLDHKYTITGTYIVAFIDVLGTKKMVKENTEQALNNLWLLNHHLYKIAAEYSKDYEKKCMIRSFSDNYLIALETSTETMKKDFECILNVVGNLFNFCIRMHRILLRGAVVLGDLHIDENIVLGEALISAYLVENERAIYPRIIIDSQLADILYSNKFLSFAKHDLTKPIFQDFDMQWCLNPLMFCAKTEEARGLDVFKSNLAILFCNAQKHKDEKVFIKIKWLINYANQYYIQNYGCPLITLPLEI